MPERVPNADKAQIDPRKLRGYALNPNSIFLNRLKPAKRRLLAAS